MFSLFKVEIYAYAASRYCRRHSELPQLFITLLELFLQPVQKGVVPMLGPALELLARQSRSLDPALVLNLLPAMLTVADIQRFLASALKRQAAGKDSALITRDISRSRLDQLQRAKVLLEEQRVVVTDTRLCPGCHKRLGNSVIAVHLPNGEVTHFQCRHRLQHQV